MSTKKPSNQAEQDQQFELLTKLNQRINKLNEKLSAVQERVSVGVREAQDDYRNIRAQFENIGHESKLLRQSLPIDEELKFYLLFLEINFNYNLLKNKIELTHYLIMIFQSLLK